MHALLVGQYGRSLRTRTNILHVGQHDRSGLRIVLPWLLRDGLPPVLRRPKTPGVSPGRGPTLR
jgi:hypothetical protein